MMPATSAVLIFTAVLLLLWTLSQRSHEGYMETSYYYEAAPGTRGAKMVCMPEKGSQASLGVAVGAAARYAQRQGGCPVPKPVSVKARPACTTSCCVPSCSKPQAVSGGKCKIPASLLAKLKAAVWDPTRPPQTAEQKALIKAVLAEMKKAKKTPTKGTKTKKKAPAKGKKPSTKKKAPAKGKKPSKGTKKPKGKTPTKAKKPKGKTPTKAKKPKGKTPTKAKKPKTLSKKKAGAGPLGSASYAANMNATNVAYGK